MDFVNDTPTSEYGLSLELMGYNTGGPWNRMRGLAGVLGRENVHVLDVNQDPNGYVNTAFPQMPGDVRDFGWGW